MDAGRYQPNPRPYGRFGDANKIRRLIAEAKRNAFSVVRARGTVVCTDKSGGPVFSAVKSFPGGPWLITYSETHYPQP
jgi:hypothetical protein